MFFKYFLLQWDLRPGHSAASVIAALVYLKHFHTGQLKQGIVTACEISFDCVSICVANWSLIFYRSVVLFFLFLFSFYQCGPLCETVILFNLPAKKKENLNFANLGFLLNCKMFCRYLKQTDVKALILQRYYFQQCLSSCVQFVLNVKAVRWSSSSFVQGINIV